MVQTQCNNPAAAERIQLMGELHRLSASGKRERSIAAQTTDERETVVWEKELC